MYHQGLPASLTRSRKARSLRASSWDTSGRNGDAWRIDAGEVKVLADIKGPGCINHIWMTQRAGYRDVLIRVFWDDEESKQIFLTLANDEFNHRRILEDEFYVLSNKGLIIWE